MFYTYQMTHKSQTHDKGEIAELREMCARIESKIDNLEKLVHLLQKSSKTPVKPTQQQTNVATVATWPRPDYTWREWWHPVISSTDYELLDYLPYHDCLKQTLIKHTAESSAPLASLYRGETYSLYIYNNEKEKDNPEWKLADNQDVLEMLDLLNLAFHRYYFDHVETKLNEREKERDKEREKDRIERQMINLCKINENKYRDELRLRDVRKSLAKKIGTK